jgi:hypothetical protein
VIAHTTRLSSARYLPHLPVAFIRACRNQGALPSRLVLVVSVRKQLLWLFEKASEQQNSVCFPPFRLYPLSEVGTSRWDVPARAGACGKRAANASNQLQRIAPLHAARTAQRAIPTTLDTYGGRAPNSTLFQFRKRFLISTSRFGVGQKNGSNQTPLGLHRIAEKIGGGQPVGTVFRNRRTVGLTWQGLPDAPIAHRILWLEGLEPGFNRGGGVDTHSRYIYIHGTGDETTLGRPASCGCIHVSSTDLLGLFDRVPGGTLVWVQ